MLVQKRFSFGFGTIFSLIVVYFIFLYSRGKGWVFLAPIAKWYLIIVSGLIAFSIGVILLVILFFLVIFLISALKVSSFGKKYKKQKSKEYVDAEYSIRE